MGRPQNPADTDGYNLESNLNDQSVEAASYMCGKGDPFDYLWKQRRSHFSDISPPVRVRRLIDKRTRSARGEPDVCVEVESAIEGPVRSGEKTLVAVTGRGVFPPLCGGNSANKQSMNAARSIRSAPPVSFWMSVY